MATLEAEIVVLVGTTRKWKNQDGIATMNTQSKKKQVHLPWFMGRGTKEEIRLFLKASGASQTALVARYLGPQLHYQGRFGPERCVRIKATKRAWSEFHTFFTSEALLVVKRIFFISRIQSDATIDGYNDFLMDLDSCVWRGPASSSSQQQQPAIASSSSGQQQHGEGFRQSGPPGSEGVYRSRRRG